MYIVLQGYKITKIYYHLSCLRLKTRHETPDDNCCPYLILGSPRYTTAYKALFALHLSSTSLMRPGPLRRGSLYSVIVFVLMLLSELPTLVRTPMLNMFSQKSTRSASLAPHLRSNLLHTHNLFTNSNINLCNLLHTYWYLYVFSIDESIFCTLVIIPSIGTPPNKRPVVWCKLIFL